MVCRMERIDSTCRVAVQGDWEGLTRRGADIATSDGERSGENVFCPGVHRGEGVRCTERKSCKCRDSMRSCIEFRSRHREEQ